MDQEVLLRRVKQAIHEVEPTAEIYPSTGSRSREDAGAESDWDFLVLIDGPVTDARIDTIRHRLYDLEWGEWRSPLLRCTQPCGVGESRYRAMPFHQNVEREGIVL